MDQDSQNDHPEKQLLELDSVAIRFAGDSGDGMQLTGDRFSNATAFAGNDLSTFPDFPAEIRAPQGTLAGVSGFQINFSRREVHTPGDELDVLVAMNPAALMANLNDLKKGGILIVNEDAFTDKNLQKAGFVSNPLEDNELKREYQVFPVKLSTLTRNALEDLGLPSNTVDRCKNFFALGLMFWLYSRPMDNTKTWVQQKFGKRVELVEANIRAMEAGYHYGEHTDAFASHYIVPEAPYPPGLYRNISGNTALAFGFVAAARQSGLKLFWGAYPITPASDVLHELSIHKNFNIYTFQAEDEIAAITSSIGASYAGALGVTCSSGPGIALKGEAMGLAVMAELPLVIVNIQRGGPSTGLPTKTEQADLLMMMYGRNSEAPIPILAARSPSDCFWTAVEAVRIAVKYMTPVIILSDGYLGNGSEPWLIPKLSELPEIKVKFRTDPEGFQPYARDPDTLARPWVVPGTPRMEHRIGGLEKEDGSGNVSYDPENHDHMVRTRAEKVARIANDVPPLEVVGADSGKVLVLGWGSTYGAITAAVEALQARGASVSQAHLRHLNPFPKNLGEVLSRFEEVIVPELNLGQLSRLIRAEFLVDAISYSKVQGKPFMVSEIINKIEELL